MKWMRNHKKITLLFGIVFILLIIMGFSYNDEGKSSKGASLIQQAVVTVQEPLGKAGNAISGSLRGIFRFGAVTAENEKLKEENGNLRKENISLKLSKAELEELREMTAVLNYSGVTPKTGLVTADVIAMEGSNWFNIFTINCGTEKGIQMDQIVVNGSGLVGRVLDSGEGWSRVVGIIDESNKLSFKVLRDQKLMGVVQGDGANGLAGFMLDGKASVIEGDVLVTTNIGIYPEGIEIGEISEITYDNDAQLKRIKVIPKVNFKSIQKVAVIL